MERKKQKGELKREGDKEIEIGRQIDGTNKE